MTSGVDIPHPHPRSVQERPKERHVERPQNDLRREVCDARCVRGVGGRSKAMGCHGMLKTLGLCVFFPGEQRDLT